MANVIEVVGTSSCRREARALLHLPCLVLTLRRWEVRILRASDKPLLRGLRRPCVSRPDTRSIQGQPWRHPLATCRALTPAWKIIALSARQSSSNYHCLHLWRKAISSGSRKKLKNFITNWKAMFIPDAVHSSEVGLEAPPVQLTLERNTFSKMHVTVVCVVLLCLNTGGCLPRARSVFLDK